LRTLILFLGLLPALCGAAPSDDLLLDPNADLEPVVQVSAAQMGADLDVLADAASKGYAGPDLSGVLAAVRQRLPGATDAFSFCKQLESAFSGIADSHLRASLVTKSCSSVTVKGSVGKNIRSGHWAFDTYDTSAGKITVVALPSFLPREDQGWEGFLAKVRDLKAAGRPFVIDLRGNMGGDDDMGYEMARILYGLGQEDHVPTPVEARLHIETPESFALMANAWAYQAIQMKRGGQAVPWYIYDWRNRYLQWMDTAKSGSFPAIRREDMPQTNLRGHDVFSAPVYVLVDKLCASACENTLEFLEALPHRVLVGENSFGMVDYGDLGRVALPNSHVIVSLATFSSRFRDYREVEKTGYKPDVPVPPGNDALAAALSLITN
jgi:hypothetical protein